MTTPYFRPSLHVPAASSYALVAAALASLPSAWLYAWATAPSPSLLDPLYTLGFGLWLALLARTVATLGKNRHPSWMWRAGAALGGVAWYVQWAVWIAMSGQPGPVMEAGLSMLDTSSYLCLRPDLMLVEAAGLVGDASSALAGAALVVVWLVELCACILPPAMAGARRAAAPFCEETASWAKECHVPVRFRFIDDPDTVRRRLECDPRELYSILVPCSDEAQQFAEVTIHRCRGKESFVTICNFGALAPEEVPIPEVGNLIAATPDELECYGQIDEPIVELLRFPVEHPDALIRRWEDEAAGSLAYSGGDGKT